MAGDATTPAPAVDPKELATVTAKKYGLPSQLVNGVIQQESQWNPNAVSDKGAQGLMQLMPDTAKQMGVQDSFDPAQNIEGGTKYLKSLYDKYQGDVPKTLAAYNAGPDKVDSGKPLPTETQNYVKSIMSKYRTYDVDAARQSGLSDDDIVNHLQQTRDFDVEGAKKAGYSSKELADYLATLPKVREPLPVQQEHVDVRPVTKTPPGTDSGENPALGALPGASSAKNPIQVTPGAEAKGPGVEGEPSVGELAASAAANILPGGGRVISAAKGAVGSGAATVVRNKQAGLPLTTNLLKNTAIGAGIGLVTGGAPKLDKAMTTVEKTAEDAGLAGAKVNPTNALLDYTKTLPTKQAQPIWDALTSNAKKLGIKPTSVDLDDFLKLREAVHDSVPEGDQEAVWEAMSKDFRAKLPGNVGETDKALGVGTKIVTPPQTAAPAAPSISQTPSKGASIAKKAVGAAVGAGITGSFARYARNRMLWELLDKAKDMVFH